MKKSIFIIVLLTLLSSNVYSSTPIKEVELIGLWNLEKQFLNGEDFGKQSLSIEIFSDHTFKFTYKNSGPKGEDIIDYGVWKVNQNQLAIEWNNPELGEGFFYLEIMEIDKNTLIWKAQSQEGTLIETYIR